MRILYSIPLWFLESTCSFWLLRFALMACMLLLNFVCIDEGFKNKFSHVFLFQSFSSLNCSVVFKLFVLWIFSRSGIKSPFLKSSWLLLDSLDNSRTFHHSQAGCLRRNSFCSMLWILWVMRPEWGEYEAVFSISLPPTRARSFPHFWRWWALH